MFWKINFGDLILECILSIIKCLFLKAHSEKHFICPEKFILEILFRQIRFRMYFICFRDIILKFLFQFSFSKITFQISESLFRKISRIIYGSHLCKRLKYYFENYARKEKALRRYLHDWATHVERVEGFSNLTKTFIENSPKPFR